MNIEELAFKDRKILANLNAVDLLNIIEFLQDDRRQCLEWCTRSYNVKHDYEMGLNYSRKRIMDYLGTLEDRLEKLEKDMEQMAYKVGE